MAVSLVQVAKRVLVTLILAVAQQCGVQTSVARESSDDVVETMYRKVVKRVHSDKGGHVADAQRLQVAVERWRVARSKSEKRRPSQLRVSPALPSSDPAVADPKSFLIRSNSILLTFHGVQQSCWKEFIAFVHSNLSQWSAIHWCASMELCESGKPHIHLMLQFASAKYTRQVAQFTFGQSRPNASTTDLCGEGQCKKQLQRSIDRGFFYTFANKVGTLHTDGNYMPCWTECSRKYQVLGKWPETLWKQRKICSEVYEEYLFLSRDGVMSRKRNLQACREHEEATSSQRAVEARIKRIRANPDLFQPFPHVPDAVAWLHLFDKDALRYPIMVVLGPSRAGKTEWAKSLFRNALELKIGSLQFFPDGMRRSNRSVHDGPVIATVNMSTKNLAYLEDHDWMGNPGNRVLVTFPGVHHNS